MSARKLQLGLSEFDLLLFKIHPRDYFVMRGHLKSVVEGVKMTSSLTPHSLKKRTVPKINVKEVFGAAIRKRRKELGLSQEELAERADLHRTYVSDVERGSRNVSLENIERLARALELSVSALFPSEYNKSN